MAAGGDRAERLLDVAIGVLRVRPPVGVDPEYVEGFAARNRAVLVGIVQGALTSEAKNF